MNISDFVNYEYINELEINYTNCLNYSYNKLNEIIKEDEINYKKYLDYLELIESNKNCSDKNNTLNDNDSTFDLGMSNNSCINISEIEPVIYFNKTEHLLNCFNNVANVIPYYIQNLN